jgi:hypothetical protein
MATFFKLDTRANTSSSSGSLSYYQKNVNIYLHETRKRMSKQTYTSDQNYMIVKNYTQFVWKSSNLSIHECQKRIPGPGETYQFNKTMPSFLYPKFKKIQSSEKKNFSFSVYLNNVNQNTKKGTKHSQHFYRTLTKNKR